MMHTKTRVYYAFNRPYFIANRNAFLLKLILQIACTYSSLDAPKYTAKKNMLTTKL